MKTGLIFGLAFFTLLAGAAHAASDADVTFLKVKNVFIEESLITITVAEAKMRITLIRGDHDPAFTGDTWNGMPVSRVQVISNKAIFMIKRPTDAAPGGPLATAWQESLKAAKALQDGKTGGQIGYYAPDILIKGNMVDSITGFGFLYENRK